jgi:ABC-type transporter Mla subunit MlaD
MSDAAHAPSAAIIAFPRRPVDAAPVETPQARLARALAALDGALSQQRAVVAQWRDSVAQLQASMSGLGQSLHRYRDRLATLSGEVAVVNTQAKDLADWAARHEG